MSRVAKNPITIPSGITVKIDGSKVAVKGAKGELSLELHPMVAMEDREGTLYFTPVGDAKAGWAMAGTYRALVNNLVVGAGQGFEKKLALVGVGYRAQAKGDVLSLSLGFSHPVEYPSPKGITITTPSQTEVIVAGSDKQQVGQTAAEIRAFRPPEPYKGKGVRYADEVVVRKEAKKK